METPSYLRGTIPTNMFYMKIAVLVSTIAHNLDPVNYYRNGSTMMLIFEHSA